MCIYFFNKIYLFEIDLDKIGKKLVKKNSMIAMKSIVKKWDTFMEEKQELRPIWEMKKDHLDRYVLEFIIFKLKKKNNNNNNKYKITSFKSL